jgi:thioredoxin-related protein
MKKGIISLIIVLLSAGYINAQSVNFIDGKWEDVKAKAKAENKYLFVDCYTEWCGFCKMLDKNTFSNAKVAEIMNKNFVSVKIDMEKDYGINLCMKYRVNGFPTALVFNPEGQLVYRIMGYAEPAQYLELINKALDPATQSGYKGITDKVDLDFPQFYRDVYAGNGKRKWPEKKTVTDFLDQQKDLFNEVSWSVLATLGGGEKYTQYLLNNIDEYSKLYGSEVDEKVNAILYQKLDDAIKNKDENKFIACLNDVGKYISVNKEETLQTFKLTYYSGVNDWMSFTQEFKVYIEKNGYKDVNSINSYCWGIYEKCNDPKIISQAAEWMKNAIEKDSQYAFVDTYASLLYKSRNYSEAEKIANLAISTGKKAGEDVKTTEELLVKIKKDASGK